jgi:hypothetical protein
MEAKSFKKSLGTEMICRKNDVYGSQRRSLLLAVMNLLL